MLTLSDIVARLGGTQTDYMNLPIRLKVGETEVSLGDYELRLSRNQLVFVGKSPRKRSKKERIEPRLNS